MDSIVVTCLLLTVLTIPTAGLGRAEEAKKPSRGSHFGDIADPRQWPISSIGVVTIPWGIGSITSCTGTLVGPKLVLTAAHCVYHGDKLVTPEHIHFAVGLDRGVPAGHSLAANLKVANSYDQNAHGPMGSASDWALITLADTLAAKPIVVHGLTKDEFTEIARARSAIQVGYGSDRRFLPSIVKECAIEDGPSDSVFVYRCLTNHGYSGAPIIAEIEGKPTVIGIGSRIPGAPDAATLLGSLARRLSSQSPSARH